MFPPRKRLHAGNASRFQAVLRLVIYLKLLPAQRLRHIGDDALLQLHLVLHIIVIIRVTPELFTLGAAQGNQRPVYHHTDAIVPILNIENAKPGDKLIILGIGFKPAVHVPDHFRRL